jgi:hypothetical protein
VKESKVLFKVAGFADAQRRREAVAAGGTNVRHAVQRVSIPVPLNRPEQALRMQE